MFLKKSKWKNARYYLKPIIIIMQYESGGIKTNKQTNKQNRIIYIIFLL